MIKDVLPGRVEVPGALINPHRVSTKALQVQWRWSTYLATAFSWQAWWTATFTSTSREELPGKGKLTSTTCKGCSEFLPILELLIIIVLLWPDFPGLIQQPVLLQWEGLPLWWRLISYFFSAIIMAIWVVPISYWLFRSTCLSMLCPPPLHLRTLPQRWRPNHILWHLGKDLKDLSANKAN